MDLPLIGRKTIDLDLVVALKNKTPYTTLTTVDVGLGPAGGDSHSVTTWQTVPVAAMTATFDLVGFYCTLLTGSEIKVIVPIVGADLWAKVTDSPEVDADMIDHIRPI